jgi:hypothetical protein
MHTSSAVPLQLRRTLKFEVHLYNTQVFNTYLAENTLHLMGSIPSLKIHQFHSYSRILQSFMESEGSLPCSQQLFIGPILCQMNQVHTIPSYHSKILFNTFMCKGLA